MSSFRSNVLIADTIANVSQGNVVVTNSSSVPRSTTGNNVLVSGTTLRDGRKFRITDKALYEGSVPIHHFDKPPRSVNCSSERIVVDGKVLVEAGVRDGSYNRGLANQFLQELTALNGGIPDTSNDEVLARLLSNEYASLPLPSVHIGGDNEIVVKKPEAPKRKRATPAAAPRKKKPEPLALDWAVTALAEKHVERDECTVCLSNKRDVACQPCGHVLMCVACAVKCRDAARQKKDKFQCPECRAVIESAARVFI